MVAPLVLAIALGLFGARSVAAQPGADGPGPLNRAIRSAVFPAWGQVTNGSTTKAVLLFTVQSYVYSRIAIETRRIGEAERRQEFLGTVDPEDPAVQELLRAADTSAQEHFDRRRDLLFWALVGSFYGAIDAYIDAHLGDFDEELEEGRSVFGRVDPEEGTVEFGLRF